MTSTEITMTKTDQILHKSKSYHRWSDKDTAKLKIMYPCMPNGKIARLLHVNVQCVLNKAQQLHLKKSKLFISQQRRRNAKNPKVRATQFKRGHVPVKKGRKETEFMTKDEIKSKNMKQKTAHRAQNNLPSGMETKRSNGYTYIKTDKGMMPKHRWMWIQNHGIIPKGMRVVFLDGDKNNCSMNNLTLVSAKDAGKIIANKIPNEKRKEILTKANETRRRTIEKDKRRIAWGFPPKTKLFKCNRKTQ